MENDPHYKYKFEKNIQEVAKRDYVQNLKEKIKQPVYEEVTNPNVFKEQDYVKRLEIIETEESYNNYDELNKSIRKKIIVEEARKEAIKTLERQLTIQKKDSKKHSDLQINASKQALVFYQFQKKAIHENEQLKSRSIRHATKSKNQSKYNFVAPWHLRNATTASSMVKPHNSTKTNSMPPSPVTLKNTDSVIKLLQDKNSYQSNYESVRRI